MHTFAALLVLSLASDPPASVDSALAPGHQVPGRNAAAARSAFPVSIGLALPGGVYREHTEGVFPALTLEAGYRHDLLPRLAVVDRVEALLGFTRGVANRLGLAVGFGETELSGDMGLHYQVNSGKKKDRCSGTWGPGATDCRSSNRLVGWFADRSSYLSLGGGISCRLKGGRAFRMHMEYPVTVFTHDEEQDLRWIEGWDDNTPAAVPVYANPERRRLTVSAAYQIPF